MGKKKMGLVGVDPDLGSGSWWRFFTNCLFRAGPRWTHQFWVYTTMNPCNGSGLHHHLTPRPVRCLLYGFT